VIILIDNNVVACVNHGMIRQGGRSRRGPQMSLTPNSILADPQQIISNLRRELDECRAERDKAHRNLSETTTERGKWVVVQQGMNGERREARRYHWLSEGLKSFVEEPHAAIDGLGQGEIVNLTDRRAAPSRRMQLDILQALGPDGIARQLRGMEAWDRGPIQSPRTEQFLLPHLIMPAHHEVRPSDVFERRLRANLAAAADCGPKDFPELLLVPGVGPRTVRALAMVAEVVHGAPYRFTDPARFSVAHGGKDGHPFPVPLRVYDQTIQVMKSAVQKAKLGRAEELGALKRLDDQARQIERHATGPTVQELIAQEWQRSPSYAAAASTAGSTVKLRRRSGTAAVDEPHLLRRGAGQEFLRHDYCVLRSICPSFLERHAGPRCQPKLRGLPRRDRGRGSLFDP